MSGIVLVALGVALVVTALLMRFAVTPALSVAPLDLDPTDSSDNSGVARTYFNPGTLTEETNVPVFSNRFTEALLDESQLLGGNVGVYRTFTSVIGSDGKPLSDVTPPSQYAFDRTTSVLQATGSTVDGTALTADQVGDGTLMPLKFPFWVEQRSYQFFDDTLRGPMTLDFVDQEDLQGLTVDKFHGVVAPTKVGEADAAKGLIAGAPADFVPPIYYAVDRTVWVDPVTGRIVNGVDDTKQTLRGPDGSDAIVAFDGAVGYTAQNVTDSVAAAQADASKLMMVYRTIPLVAGILGLVLLVIGAWLLIAPYRRRRDDDLPADSSLGAVGLSA